MHANVSIEERVTRLERQNRTLRRLLIVGIVTAVSAAHLGMSATPIQEKHLTADVLTVETLRIVDENGEQFGYFGTSDHLYGPGGKKLNQVALQIGTPEKASVIEITSTPTAGIGLHLFDKSGKRRVSLEHAPGKDKDEVALRLADPTESDRLTLLTSRSAEATTAAMTIHDDDGKVAWTAP